MESTRPLFNMAVKAGIYLAIAGIVIFVIEYVAGIRPVGFVKPFLIMLVSLAVSITLLVIFLKQYRTASGGFITFGNAFLFCIAAFVTSIILSTIFTYIFIHYFDPQYIQNIINEQKEFMENYLTGKVTEEQLTDALNKIDEQAAKADSIMTTIKQMLWGLGIGVVASLIIAAIMKKDPGVFDNSGSGGVI
jgi:predicted neutral ceramidase superfamily lipid hydrolase